MHHSTCNSDTDYSMGFNGSAIPFSYATLEETTYHLSEGANEVKMPTGSALSTCCGFASS